MHSINSTCTATNVCIDEDRFILGHITVAKNLIPCPYGMVYRIAWKTEVYNFVDETTDLETERDFMFEMNLN